MIDLSNPDVLHESIPGTMELTHPEWLWVLPVLLLLTLVWRIIGCRQDSSSLATGQQSPRYRIFHPLISLVPTSLLIRKTPILNVIGYGTVIIGLVISLTEPVMIGAKLPDPPQQRDIVFIVDTSISMTLKDYVLDGKRIDRMTLLKGVLDRFIQQLPGERIGIIVFGDAAYTLVPLTHDQDLLRRMLSRIQATMVGRFNNMGESISLAVKQTLRQRIENRHRVLVMLTDADKPTGTIDPLTAATLAAEEKLPLYTIAIGATNIEAEEQRTTGLIYEPVDTALLTEIAETTGAKYYQAGSSQALENAVSEISKLETNRRIVPPRYYRETLYYWPLLFSALLLTLLTVSAKLRNLLGNQPSENNDIVSHSRQ
jgi:Ca-activated chloride channel family protein